MPIKLVLVQVGVDYGISLQEVSREEMSSEEGTYHPRHYERTREEFEGVLADLVKMDSDEDYRRTNAAGFLRKHGVWLHNLAKTGFAIDYAQYRRLDATPEAGIANCGCVYHAEQGIPCDHDIALAEERIKST